jgi:hypothetical protein
MGEFRDFCPETSQKALAGQGIFRLFEFIGVKQSQGESGDSLPIAANKR